MAEEFERQRILLSGYSTNEKDKIDRLSQIDMIRLIDEKGKLADQMKKKQSKTKKRR